VDVLEIDDTLLIRRRFKLFRGRLPTTTPLTAVVLVSLKVRQGKRDSDSQWVRMILLIDGARRTFTGRRGDGRPFAQALARRVTTAPAT
jgi:hypothetical protein